MAPTTTHQRERPNTPIADGSAAADAREIIEIDRRVAVERYRYTCPNGHIDYSRTNSHIWCRGCLRMAEAGNDVDPEHYEIVDKKTGETIPWSRVKLTEDEGR